MISANIKRIREELPDGVCLVVVSKYHSEDEIMQAYETGQRVFGENKIQDMTVKWEALPKDIEWHMIGHIQTNKVKYMAPYVAMIQSVDSLKVLQEINKQAVKNDRVIDCLLQVYIAKEDSKFGFSEEELMEMIEGEDFGKLKNVRIKGLMGMATNTEDRMQVRVEFEHLKSIFEELKIKNVENVEMKYLSMGMSMDYDIAVSCGSNIVRVGSAIFR